MGREVEASTNGVKKSWDEGYSTGNMVPDTVILLRGDRW